MRILRLLTAPFLALGLTTTAHAEDQNKLITILTTAEPQTQLMAMVLTLNAINARAEAELLLCGPAADIALVDAPVSAPAVQPPKNASPQGLM
jgi:hypothetical protein